MISFRSFGKLIVSDSPLHCKLHLQSLNSTFGETDREAFRRKSNLIRDRQILRFCQSKKTFRIGKLSLSFSHTLFLWFWAFQGNKQCTCSHDKQSASLYIRQDSIDMLHSLTQGHAHTAIGCNQKLMRSVPRRGLQSYDA